MGSFLSSTNEARPTTAQPRQNINPNVSLYNNMSTEHSSPRPTSMEISHGSGPFIDTSSGTSGIDSESEKEENGAEEGTSQRAASPGHENRVAEDTQHQEDYTSGPHAQMTVHPTVRVIIPSKVKGVDILEEKHSIDTSGNDSEAATPRQIHNDSVDQELIGFRTATEVYLQSKDDTTPQETKRHHSTTSESSEDSSDDEVGVIDNNDDNSNATVVDPPGPNHSDDVAIQHNAGPISDAENDDTKMTEVEAHAQIFEHPSSSERMGESDDDESETSSLYAQFNFDGWEKHEVKRYNRIAPPGGKLQDFVSEEEESSSDTEKGNPEAGKGIHDALSYAELKNLPDMHEDGPAIVEESSIYTMDEENPMAHDEETNEDDSGDESDDTRLYRYFDFHDLTKHDVKYLNSIAEPGQRLEDALIADQLTDRILSHKNEKESIERFVASLPNPVAGAQSSCGLPIGNVARDLNRFRELHPFTQLVKEGRTFTTSQRRNFEREIYDFSRSYGLTSTESNHAVAWAKVHAETLHEGIHSNQSWDSSQWDGEQDDQIDFASIKLQDMQHERKQLKRKQYRERRKRKRKTNGFWSSKISQPNIESLKEISNNQRGTPTTKEANLADADIQHPLKGEGTENDVNLGVKNENTSSTAVTTVINTVKRKRQAYNATVPHSKRRKRGHLVPENQDKTLTSNFR
ncbi:uncharacterized protein KY384_008924 [Bacidia gigantensis]|uniref:uncharacterized protein n=1 Tax=Bacidia gigantensis TaxID=2732470 RepID=UPI001D04B077|nr:uncharacterized protein KY384_008924 [Bacidia gigantensis]KAG8525280.1 hypothetical protein KY384_008924 [Bacidia gigantensis]